MWNNGCLLFLAFTLHTFEKILAVNLGVFSTLMFNFHMKREENLIFSEIQHFSCQKGLTIDIYLILYFMLKCKHGHRKLFFTPEERIFPEITTT